MRDFAPPKNGTPLRKAPLRKGDARFYAIFLQKRVFLSDFFQLLTGFGEKVLKCLSLRSENLFFSEKT
jgi:hypothetical protein